MDIFFNVFFIYLARYFLIFLHSFRMYLSCFMAFFCIFALNLTLFFLSLPSFNSMFFFFFMGFLMIVVCRNQFICAIFFFLFLYVIANIYLNMLPVLNYIVAKINHWFSWVYYPGQRIKWILTKLSKSRKTSAVCWAIVISNLHKKKRKKNRWKRT